MGEYVQQSDDKTSKQYPSRYLQNQHGNPLFAGLRPALRRPLLLQRLPDSLLPWPLDLEGIWLWAALILLILFVWHEVVSLHRALASPSVFQFRPKVFRDSVIAARFERA